MAAEAHAFPVADLRQDDPVGGAPATGARLATRLAEACADYGLKRHLGLPEILGRDPTPDETAIHAAAAAAGDAALEALASWAPGSWEEFADKSEALDRARATGCVSPEAGQHALLADLRRLALTKDVGALESAIPVWVRERERQRGRDDPYDDEDARADLLIEAKALILRAPCSSFKSVSAKLKALTDRQVGLQHGPGRADLPCLEQIIAFLDQELCGGAAGLSSRLAPALIEALRLAEQAAETGYSEDGDIWLGEPLEERAGELLDGIHLAPCTSRADAAIKLGALQADLDETEDWSSVRATVTASVVSLRCWLLGLPSKIVIDGIITRKQVRQRWAENSGRLADEENRRDPSLSDAAMEVGLHHLERAVAEYGERHPELRGGRS